MPEAHYCGKSVGNSSAQMAETIVNTGSLPLRRHLAVTHDLAQKKRALLFTNTLILFHLGVLVGYFAVEYLGAHGIWVAFVPLVTAVGLVIPVGEEQVVKDVEATLKEGIHRTEEVVVRKV